MSLRTRPESSLESSIPARHPPRVRTLAQAIDDHAARTPTALALVDTASGARWTYAELALRARAVAADLRPGQRVAVLALNSAHTFVLLAACSRAGAILVPLNHRLAEAELEAVLDRCRPDTLWVDGAHAGRLTAHARRALEGLEQLPDDLTSVADPRPLDEPRIMLFTSGTTGRPKGALLTERNVAANAASTAHAWGLGPRDVALIDAPLFHTGGLNVLATPLLHAGGAAIVAPRFDAEASGELLVREGCTVAFGVPTMLERFLAGGVVDRARVRLWVTGGAPCPRTLLDAFAARGARLVQGFGMTECGPNCFAPHEGEGGGPVPGSIGVPTRDLEARLVGEDGRDVALGEAGELWLRGPHRFAGYFDDETATRAAIDGEGWLHTGDVLRATPEGWWVAGRKKEMFISGGENVYPAEVEAALMMHLGVAEAAVIGVPDPKWGEAGVAFVLARDALASPGPDELRAFVRTRLAGYKVPRQLRVVAELPRTASNKIDRRALAAIAAADQEP